MEMASDSSLLVLSSFMFLYCSSLVHAADLSISPSAPIPVDNACNSTPYPYFCRSMLPNVGSRNLYDYGRFSLARSLTEASRFSGMIDRYLSLHASLSVAARRALEDCRLLASLNIDFLTETGATLNSTRTTLVDPQVDQFQTLLSAILTNQETCLDGLQATASAWTVRNGLSFPISNSNKLYSVSLALFSRAWVPRGKRSQWNPGFVSGRIPVEREFNSPKGRTLLFHELKEIDHDVGIPMTMSDEHREIYETRKGRRLHQAASGIQVLNMVVVSKNGTGNFSTINAAIASAPNNTNGNNGYYLIYVTAGLYEEYISVPKNNKYLMLMGDGINQTIITGNRSVNDGWTTYNSATLAVVGQGFVAAYMTFRNTAGAAKHQAVAVRAGADLSSFYRCSFEGYQDTLYAHSLRQFYRECNIYGTVDFIFGNAAVVFQNCNIYSRPPLSGQSNTITAQGRSDPNQNTGTSMQNCTFTAAPDLAASGGSISTYLGRPWRLFSRTVIMESFMDASINTAGWLPWNGNCALSTLYYAEYSNTGPGSETAGRVQWPGYYVINGTDAGKFTVGSFLMGDSWLPQAGIPFLSGLATEEDPLEGIAVISNNFIL